MLNICYTASQVVIASSEGRAGGLNSPEAQALLTAAHTPPVPDKAVILVDLSDPQSVSFWEKRNPEALAMVQGHFHGAAGGGAPVALVCQNFTCQSPTSDPGKVIQLLKQEMRAVTGAGAPAGPADLKEAKGLPGM